MISRDLATSSDPYDSPIIEIPSMKKEVTSTDSDLMDERV
jgi:hypothetical protein